MENLDNFDSNIHRIKGWLYILGVLGVVAFYFFTIYGLPPRVDKLESDVSALEKKIVATEIKTDMILQSVTRTENFILTRHGDGN